MAESLLDCCFYDILLLLTLDVFVSYSVFIVSHQVYEIGDCKFTK